MVNICRTIRVQTRHQRHDIGQIGEIIPVNQNPGRTRHSHQVHRMVGRAPGRQQRNNTVHNHFFIDHFTDRHPFIAVAGQTRYLTSSRGGQRLAQRGIRVYE